MRVSTKYEIENIRLRLTALMDSIKADHGFNMDSKSVRNLLQTMSELNTQQRRDFLQFVTGSPKLPIGGKSLSASPPLRLQPANLVQASRVSRLSLRLSAGLASRRTRPMITFPV